MTDPNFELCYIQAGLEELEAYLLSKELFWHVNTPPKVRTFPMLTLANLLLSLANLKAYSTGGQLAPTQNTEYAQLRRKIEALRQKWTVAWEAKTAHEYKSRLRQWLYYLNDLKAKEEDHAPYYTTEVRNRVLLELLKENSPESAQPDLANLDTFLRAKLTTSDFIWDPEVQTAFPPEEYWFLYGSP
jgi:hypothetical protein